MKRILSVAAVLLVALAAVSWAEPASAAPPAAHPADLILRNGHVWTADPARPAATAVAVRDGRVIYVGDDAGASALGGPKTHVVDLEKRLLLPGFEDGHIHLMEGALSLEHVDLIEDATLTAVQDHIRRFAAERATAPWVLGRGWLYGTFPGGLPTKAQLDAAVSDRPAYMECYDGHSGWANSKALALAGITRETPDPPRGVIVRDASGEPTGALKEAATSLVSAKIPTPGDAERYELLKRALKLLNAYGVVAVQDAGFSPDDLANDLPLLERAEKEGLLTVRVRASVVLSPTEWPARLEKARAVADRLRGPRLQFGAVKGFVDGVVEAHTAAMLEPYSDDPKIGTGLPNWEPKALQDAVTAADKAGLQVWLHAIGDRGIRMALDAHQAAATANGPRDRRGRIEHIETLDPADVPRFKDLGVIASMQPLHANPDQNNSEVWSKNIGPERASHGFNWARLEKAGARLLFGSDWPVVTPDVRRGLFCAVTRKTREGTPAGGWLPEQAVTLDSALRHYTADAAFAGFAENDRGRIAPGMRADLVVLSPDILQEKPESILDARVMLTLLDGRVVHRDGAFAAGVP